MTDDFLQGFKRFIKIIGPKSFIRVLLMFQAIDQFFELAYDCRWSQVDEEVYNLLSSKYGEKLVKQIFAENKIIWWKF